ncbi:MAG: PQQ-dependent sugar dehydrogenase [Chitinophagaceae bacterium]
MRKPLHPYWVTCYGHTNRELQLLKVSSFSFIFLPLLFLFFFNKTTAQTLPSGFSQVMVANGIADPTVMAFAPDGRIFVAQQTGQLRVIKNGTLLAQPFISLSVSSSGERGLLGIAFDPNFNSNNYIYLYYTLSSAANNRISRFTANGDVVVPGSEMVLLNLDPLSGATNHNGGTMQFGPDGKLYVGIGENADAVNSQNTDTYHGKLLRINPDGSVPPGNPFTTGSNQQLRIWSYGLRNPYTISFQPGTGKLFVNDVGSSVWEEINDATTGGKNYGWPYEEGNGSQFSSPVYAYPHGSGNTSGCAITGGTFFNPSSTNYPSSYIGKYFFLDYCSNWINTITLNGSTATQSNFAGNIAGSPVSLTTGTDGNLYFLSRDNSAVYKITYTGSSGPVITNQPQSLTVAQGNTATFNVTATGGAPLTYQWRKNGTNISGATNASYTISSTTATNAGTYSVVVNNSSGTATSNDATLTVTSPNKPPVATITTPAAGATYAGGSVISFNGTATDPENGNLAASSYSWYVLFHHDTHTHPGPTATTGATNGSFTIPNTGETAPNVFYRLYLVVTDQQGAKDTAYTDILPRTSTITLNTVPQGLNITLDGQPFATPLTVTSVEGVLRAIGTVSPQTINGTAHNFISWSQGGSQTQTIATPVNDATYTANFASPVVITSQPQNIIVSQGNTATLNVTATGTAPMTYQWRKNGADVTGATGSAYTISSVTTASAGTYSVVVTNAAGNVTSTNATLTVTTSPVITNQPQNITTTAGNAATFSVTASGTEPLSYQWTKDGSDINGATSAAYSIASVTVASAGIYSVVVSNSNGRVTSNNATLTVTSLPVITTQPQSITVVPGNNATFGVTASGTAPLAYQWQKDGATINGATGSTYTITSATVSDAGNYSVVVSNANGNITSTDAVLNVTVSPNRPPSAAITTPVAGTTYAGGDIIKFSGSGTDPESGALDPGSYTWYVKFYHDLHEHPGPVITFGVQTGFFIIPNTGETATDVFYRLYLVVTDKEGATDTAYTDILPRTSTFTINTNPQGLAVTLDGQSFNSPLAVTSVEGMIRTISTPTPQVVNGITYHFDIWLQGGEQTQTFATAATDTIYTANFVADQQDSLRNPDNPSNTVNGLDYSYHHGTWNAIPDFTGLFKEKAGTTPNFDLSQRTENDNFAFHFTGYIDVPVDGLYTFYTSSDAGSKLYIGSTVVVDNDGIHDMLERSGQIGLKAGKHQITVDYFEQSLQQGLSVSYEGPGLSKQLIPDTVLFRVIPDLIVLNPVADAHVRSGTYDNINVGASPVISIGNTDENYEAYLRFDISQVRTGLSSARLRLYGGISGITVSPVSLDIYSVSSISWLERTITNLNKPAADQTLLASTTITVSPGQYYEWDLTQYIEQLRNSGNLYFSVLIKNGAGANNVIIDFNSKENTANKPELKIEYLPLITQAKGVRTANATLKSMDEIVEKGIGSLSVYPNPAVNNFTLKYSPEFRNRKLRILDANGKQLKEVLLTGVGSQNIKVANLKEGLYFIYIDVNNKRYSQKVVIGN